MTLRARNERRVWWTVVIVPGLVACPLIAAAQTVRGTVYDQARPTPAAGAIVTLERFRTPFAAAEQVHSVLTDEAGSYAIRTTSIGTHRILVRRIGSTPYRSETFSMSAGEVRRLDVHLQRLNAVGEGTAELERITVMRLTPCETDTANAVRIAKLWDDARTALVATEISYRDSLVPKRMVRFIRDLNPETLGVQSEMLYDFVAPAGSRPGFTSPSGDSLSQVGYWRRINKSSFRFYGPDANALLSQAFVEDHCFSIAADVDRPGEVGIAFEPVRYRRNRNVPPEISGVVWLDSLTSELRSVEFNWLSFPIRGPTQNLGGEVRFTRLPTGPWLVHRWRLRMPQEVFVADSRNRSNVARTKRFGIVEEGGFIDSPTTRKGERPAAIAGTVRDGDGRSLAGARVTIVGTAREAMTDLRGRYSIDGVPPGVRIVIAEHEQYQALGVRAGEAKVLLDEGALRDVSFDGPDAVEVSNQLCGGRADRSDVTLRLTVIDSATTRPMKGLRLSLAERTPSRGDEPYSAEVVTDDNGVVLICDAPANRPLTMTARIGRNSARVELKLPRGLTNQTLRWPGAPGVKL